MKALWFTNVMLPECAEALKCQKVNVGGWMPALVDAVRQYAPKIKLGIACKSDRTAKCEVAGVEYWALGPEVASAAEEAVRDFIPDVIHVHGTESIAQELPADILRNKKTLASIQGIVTGCMPHYSGGIARADIRLDRNFLKEILKGTGLFQLQDRWMLKRSPREVSIFNKVVNFAGRTAWDRAWTEYLAPSARYFMVGELLRAPFYRGQRAEAEISRHTIYCSASMTYPLKGGHWLLRAICALKRKYPDVRLRVVAAQAVERPKSFIGRLRWMDYHRYLSRLIRDLGVETNVELLPSLPAEHVAEELRHAEVFCLPSHCENSPNSLGEAMLIGVPCVATYVGGVPSILENGKEGLLVPSGDPAVLADAIDRLFSKRDVARRYADAAYATAIKRYDPKTVVDQLVAAYETICGKKVS